MSNKRRGEIHTVLAGQPWRFCLTLGALAEIESHFGVNGLASLGERLTQGNISAHDLVAIAAAAARGGGMSVADSDVAQLPSAAALADITQIVAQLFAETFPPAADTPVNP
ncbi:MAG: gene transfer agent family protein [Beijerinckiaceae bacterium]